MCSNKVLDMLTRTNATNKTDSDSSYTNSGRTMPVSIRVEYIGDAFRKMLKSLRDFDTSKPKKRRSKLKVTPEKSGEVKDFEGQVMAEKVNQVKNKGKEWQIFIKLNKDQVNSI